jgi:coniferyl-aldehyde dehydrogenase
LNPSQDAAILQEEIFGPILPIMVYKNLDEVIKYINERPKPLAVYFYGKATHPDSIRVFNQTSSGAYMTNDCLM